MYWINSPKLANVCFPPKEILVIDWPAGRQKPVGSFPPPGTRWSFPHNSCASDPVYKPSPGTPPNPALAFSQAVFVQHFDALFVESTACAGFPNKKTPNKKQKPITIFLRILFF